MLRVVVTGPGLGRGNSGPHMCLRRRLRCATGNMVWGGETGPCSLGTHELSDLDHVAYKVIIPVPKRHILGWYTLLRFTRVPAFSFNFHHSFLRKYACFYFYIFYNKSPRKAKPILYFYIYSISQYNALCAANTPKYCWGKEPLDKNPRKEFSLSSDTLTLLGFISVLKNWPSIKRFLSLISKYIFLWMASHLFASIFY